MYAQFFGTFLLSHNVVTKDQLLSALGKKILPAYEAWALSPL